MIDWVLSTCFSLCSCVVISFRRRNPLVPVIGLLELASSGDLVTVQPNGRIRVWQMNAAELEVGHVCCCDDEAWEGGGSLRLAVRVSQASATAWRRLFGIVRQMPLRLELEVGRVRVCWFELLGLVSAARNDVCSV